MKSLSLLIVPVTRLNERYLVIDSRLSGAQVLGNGGQDAIRMR
jgi:hypothetical protein